MGISIKDLYLYIDFINPRRNTVTKEIKEFFITINLKSYHIKSEWVYIYDLDLGGKVFGYIKQVTLNYNPNIKIFEDSEGVYKVLGADICTYKEYMSKRVGLIEVGLPLYILETVDKEEIFKNYCVGEKNKKELNDEEKGGII